MCSHSANQTSCTYRPYTHAVGAWILTLGAAQKTDPLFRYAQPDNKLNVRPRHRRTSGTPGTTGAVCAAEQCIQNTGGKPKCPHKYHPALIRRIRAVPDAAAVARRTLRRHPATQTKQTTTCNPTKACVRSGHRLNNQRLLAP